MPLSQSSQRIKAALENACVVVLIWTAGAMIPDYVYAEAVAAQAQGKLVNVQPADMSFRHIPEPFAIHHIDEAENHTRILATMAKVMAGTPIPPRVPLHQIYFRHHSHRLFDPRQSKLARDPPDVGLMELLQAKFGVVPYIDVTSIQADVIDWCGCLGWKVRIGSAAAAHNLRQNVCCQHNAVIQPYPSERLTAGSLAGGIAAANRERTAWADPRIPDGALPPTGAFLSGRMALPHAETCHGPSRPEPLRAALPPRRQAQW